MKDFKEIKREIDILTGSKQEMALGLYEKLLFIDSQLIALQDALITKGWTEEYSNGATQKGIKTSSEANTYIQLGKLYSQLLRQLETMLAPVMEQPRDLLHDFLYGDDEAPKAPDNFINSGKRVEKR